MFAKVQAQVAESTRSDVQFTPEPAETLGRELESDISDLARLQTTMTLEQLLRQVLRFREGLRRTLEGMTTTSAAPVRPTEIETAIAQTSRQ